MTTSATADPLNLITTSATSSHLDSNYSAPWRTGGSPPTRPGAQSTIHSYVNNIDLTVRSVTHPASIPIVIGNRKYCPNRNTLNLNNLHSIKTVSVSDRTKHFNELKIGFLNIRSLNSKHVTIYDHILDHNLDIMGLCETWLSNNDEKPLLDASPPDFISSQTARTKKSGGGVAIIHKSKYPLSKKSNVIFPSFELLLMSSSLPNQTALPFYIAIIYRPPGAYTLFLDEFSQFLSDLVTKADHLVIIGDFNIHFNDPSNALNKAFTSLIETLDFTQSITLPTHRNGNTIDLVLARGISIHDVLVLPSAKLVSDHCFITFKALIPLPSTNQRPSKTRCINNSAKLSLESALPTAISHLNNCTGSLESFTSEFNEVLLGVIDSIAPLKTRKRNSNHITPWFNDNTRALKQTSRNLEQRWRNTKLEVFRLAWDESLLKYKSALKQAKNTYYSTLIANNKNNPKFLFDTIANLTKTSLPAPPPSIIPLDFVHFFNNKVESIREQVINTATATGSSHASLSTATPSTSTSSTTHTSYTLSQFNKISWETLTKLVSTSKSTTCQLDPIPTNLFKDMLTVLGPPLLHIINKSLHSGIVPSIFKTAIIKPILKKTNLDPHILANYRPISNLPFMSKLLERAVSSQLTAYLTNNNLIDSFQSGFRSHHSTETALVRVTNDLLMAMDIDQTSLLLLLDLSAAFDTVNHSILIHRLEHLVGIKGSALDWFRSYLSNRSQRVFFNNSLSDYSTVKYGVPQGSVLGPLLFCLYMSPLGDIFRKFAINFHCYADDTQIYIPITANDSSSLHNLETCLNEVKSWMQHSFLLLNSDKSEMLLVGSVKNIHLYNNTTLNLDGCPITHKPTIRNLGVVFDSSLSFIPHIKSITKSAFFHLRNLSRIRPILSLPDAETLVHAFITSRIDYCNALFSGLPATATNGLRLVQNAAAKVLTRKRKFDHITPTLIQLHWLPIQARADFKLLLLTFKALNGLAPTYMSDLIRPYIPPRPLRSQDAGLLTSTSTKPNKVTVGGRAFTHRAPHLWNALPLAVRNANSLDIFKSKLKTYLFCLHYNLPR